MVTYAIKSIDTTVQRESSSGGVWYHFATDAFSKGWIVYGAVLAEGHVFHKRITKFEEIKDTQGSKYVQSNLGNVYREVIDDLNSNKRVLFSGTPCQIGGLKKIVEMKTLSMDNLYLIDIICHGVPSPRLFYDYWVYIEQSYEAKIKKYRFRDKYIAKWRDCKETIAINDKIVPADDWAKLYYSHEIIRPCCFNCPYTSLKRNSDVTLGDFWGIENTNLFIKDEMGVSLVIVNSKKGQKLINNLGDLVVTQKSDISYARQPQLYAPIRKPITRKIIWNSYFKKGFEGVIGEIHNKYSLYSIAKSIIHTIKAGARLILKR